MQYVKSNTKSLPLECKLHNRDRSFLQQQTNTEKQKAVARDLRKICGRKLKVAET